jgi:hypothetical protein
MKRRHGHTDGFKGKAHRDEAREKVRIAKTAWHAARGHKPRLNDRLRAVGESRTGFAASAYARRVFHRFGLDGLLTLIQHGKLEEVVAKAYAELDVLNERLDAFEDRWPEVAVKLPWHEARQAWKAAGRPRPPWYEAIKYGSYVKTWKPPLAYGGHVP